MIFNHKGDTLYESTPPFRREHLNLIRQRMQAIRDVLGENGDIIFECHSLLSLTSALQLGEIAEDFDCLYFEEPINYLNSKLHGPLKDKFRVSIVCR